MRIAWGVALVLAALPAAPASAAPLQVRLTDTFATPGGVRVPVDGEVRWRSDGRARHTVTSDTGLFHSGDLVTGRRYTLRFPAPGVYRWFCAYHGAPGGRGMSGVVLVGDVPEPPPAEPPQPRPEGPRTMRVPDEFPSIQQAVDAARPGDLVLVAPGTYEEAVVVATPNLVLRGLDRNSVILEGGLNRANGVLVTAGGVAVENLTARRFVSAGFSWVGVDGYRGSYLTALDNADHGVSVVGSRRGRLDHVLASGNPGSGIHIASCAPCDAGVLDSVGVGNGVGFSAANAGGNLLVARSEWEGNRAGILLATLDGAPGAPLRGVTVAGNLVHGNGVLAVPARPLGLLADAAGIMLAGTRGVTVERNLVEGEPAYGILVAPMIDGRLWMAAGNRVRDNLVRGTGRAGLALAAPAASGNCFKGNTPGPTMPPLLESLHRCGTAGARIGGGDPAVTAERAALLARALAADPDPQPAGQASGPQPGMADPEGAAAQPATAEPAGLPELAAIARPPAGRPVPNHKEAVVLGLSIPTTLLALLLGLYAYLLPLALYTAWISTSVWDLARRDLGGGARVTWAVVVIAVPVLGPVAYLLASRSPIPAGLRVVLVLGGLAVFAVVAVASFLTAAL